MNARLPSLNPLHPFHKPAVIDKPPVPESVPAPLKPQPALALCLPCEVIKVYDGDTATKVRIIIDLSVRYDNCWAPELNEKGGPEARDRAKEAEGKIGRLYISMDDFHNLADILTFGRVVGEIWLEGEKESESQKQIRLKLASTIKGGKLGE